MVADCTASEIFVYMGVYKGLFPFLELWEIADFGETSAQGNFLRQNENLYGLLGSCSLYPSTNIRKGISISKSCNLLREPSTQSLDHCCLWSQRRYTESAPRLHAQRILAGLKHPFSQTWVFLRIIMHISMLTEYVQTADARRMASCQHHTFDSRSYDH